MKFVQPGDCPNCKKLWAIIAGRNEYKQGMEDGMELSAYKETLRTLDKLWEDHQKVEPHHQIGCDLCIEAAKAIDKAKKGG